MPRIPIHVAAGYSGDRCGIEGDRVVLQRAVLLHLDVGDRGGDRASGPLELIAPDWNAATSARMATLSITIGSELDESEALFGETRARRRTAEISAARGSS